MTGFATKLQHRSSSDTVSLRMLFSLEMAGDTSKTLSSQAEHMQEVAKTLSQIFKPGLYCVYCSPPAPVRTSSPTTIR